MNNLVEAIKKYQANEKLTDGQLGKLLGVDRSTWSKIKSGERNPGMKFLRATAREIPKLQSLIYVEITDSGLPTTIPDTHQDGKIRRFRGWLREIIKGLIKGA